MKRAILSHRQDFIAIVALVVGALAVVIYILEHQPSFTLGKSYYTVKADFATASAVTAGQGQSVDVAGVQVGQVGAVNLHNGVAVVTMNIYKKYRPIYRDATVLLRPRTPLKDMYLALDPGTKAAGGVPDGGTLPVSNTQPDIDVDQILDSLDADTRDYLLLLLSGGAQAFQDPGDPGEAPSADAVAGLRGTFKRFAPLNRDTETFTKLLAERQANISRAVHNLQLVTRQVGSVTGQFTSLIDSSNTNFSAISSQDANLQSALTLLPGTLSQADQTLGKVQGFSNQSATTLHALIPFAHALGPALQAATPLFRDTTPVIRDQLRPFATAVQPLAKVLAPAGAALSQATPHLVKAFGVLNALFNTLAYQRPGQQSYLFWGSWLGHIANSLTSTQDAQGPIVRSLVLSICSQLAGFVTLPGGIPPFRPLLSLLNIPDPYQISACPESSQGVAP